MISVSGCGYALEILYWIQLPFEMVIAWSLRTKLYAWCNAYRKRVNAKVRNYDLRDLDTEMNKKV